MDFDFSDDQTQLRDAVSRYVEKAYSFDRRRAIETAGGFDAKAYAELAELGLTGLTISDEHGGMGMGPIEAMLVLEEMGRGMVLEPLLQAYVCAPVLQRFGSAALCASWLPKVASGECILSLAHAERGNRHSVVDVACAATASSDGHHLNGSKLNVAAAAHAGAFLVSAQLGGSPALFLVETEAAGIRVEAHTLQDGSSAGRVSFDNTPASLVSTDGQAALQLARDLGAAAACAYGVGAMEKTIAITADYMNTRKQFGATLSSFQALRHRAADLKMALELARSMSYYAFLRLGAADAERTQAVARAKVQCGRSMRLVSQDSVQLHGGIGVTDEYIVSHYFRVLTTLEMQFGDTLHHLGVVSERMTESAGVFA